MNYRHSFHAGNFADLVKHALVLWLMKTRQGGAVSGGPVTVLDTHAGAGLYDLSGDGVRSREAEAGVARLMAAADRPPLIEALAAEVAAVNPHGGVRVSPGAPVLCVTVKPETCPCKACATSATLRDSTSAAVTVATEPVMLVLL